MSILLPICYLLADALKGLPSLCLEGPQGFSVVGHFAHKPALTSQQMGVDFENREQYEKNISKRHAARGTPCRHGRWPEALRP